MITVPVIGQDPWGVDLNTALGQIGDLATNVTDEAYGATGDGVTNDAAAIQAAITAVSGAGGGIVYLPPGTYLCSPGVLAVPANVRIVGSGRKSTFLKKSSAGVLLSMSGPSTDATGATHCRYSSLENIGLNGNALSGALLQLYYADNLYIREVHFTSNADTIVETAEFWDSRFISCTFESSGGAADAIMPMVRLRNSTAASGFGFSADNVNNIAFVACRWEDFYNGALRIEQGTNNTNNPNGIFITDCKMESSNLRGGSHLRVNAECRGVYVNGLYAFAGDFFAGYATPQNIVNWAPQASELANVLIANGAVATINSGVLLFSGAGSTARLDTVIGAYTTSPTGSHIFYDASSTADFHVTNCYGSTGGQSGGTVPIRWAGQQPFKQVAGVPADASFTHTPLNGTMALDTTAGQLYARVAGVWIVVGAGTPATGDVQTFTGSGTWTKPTGAKTVTIVAIGGGGGGGSGAREPSLTLSTGGAGGGGGAYTIRTVPAALLSATETVTVGAGGTAGAAVTADGTVGNPGGNGSNSVFKSSTFLVANSGALGGGGTAVGAATGGAGGGGGANGGSGGSSSATGGAGSVGTSVGLAAPGGGSGGGVTTVAAASAGGAGGNVSSSGGNAGGTAGTAGNAGGAGVSVTAGSPLSGTGGGGGGSATAAVGGTGGAGGVYGAGGGGGGASLNGSNSGAGGVGAAGIVIVMTSV